MGTRGPGLNPDPNYRIIKQGENLYDMGEMTELYTPALS